MSDDLEQARELLSAASGSWELADDKYARTRASLATAHAAVDAAETARAMHTCLEGILQAVDALVSERPATVEGDEGMCPNCLTPWKCNGPHTAPDAPATPQVGEVWQQGDRFPSRVRVVRQMGADVWACTALHNLPSEQGHHGYVWRADDEVFCCLGAPANGWRRVSPVPAPMTEREVTAEAQGVKPEIVTFPLVAESLDEGADEDRRREREMFFGVEPASDTDIAHDSVAVLALQRHHSERYYRLIARVRAEQARADEAFGRAEKAEAEVERVRPVLATADRFEKGNVSWPVFSATVRAYREATRGA